MSEIFEPIELGNSPDHTLNTLPPQLLLLIFLLHLLLDSMLQRMISVGHIEKSS